VGLKKQLSIEHDRRRATYDMSMMIDCRSVSEILRNLTVGFEILGTSLEITHDFS